MGEFPCQNAAQLYQGVQRLDWRDLIPPDKTLAVTATGKNRQLNHTHFTALQVKNAIVDQQRQHWGERSNVDPQHPDVQVNVHIRNDRCTLSLDSSGRSLHRRGYRPAVGAAPLKESLAAALIKLTEWPGDVPLLDPLCGSGTFPLEAALSALNIAPGLFQDEFGFQTWVDFDGALWEEVKQEAESARKAELQTLVWGCDQNHEVLHQARVNARRCGLADQLRFFQQDLDTLEPPADSGFILCNPPYGERLGNREELGDFLQAVWEMS